MLASDLIYQLNWVVDEMPPWMLPRKAREGSVANANAYDQHSDAPSAVSS